MMLFRKRQNRGNPYDPDDPDNYMSRDARAGGSSVIPWMFGGMFLVATVFGLFFAPGSPLSYLPVTHVTEAPVQPDLPKAN